MNFSPFHLRFAFATALLAVALSGCESKQQKAIDQAKIQAAKTGQPQQVVSTDSKGNTVTTLIQPPASGQKDQEITTTVTPPGVPPPPPLPTQAQGPPPPPPVDVAAGTMLTIRIDQNISVKRSRRGDTFTGEVVDPVLDANNNVMIPKGAQVGGVVDVAHRRGHFKGASLLELRLTSLTLNGTSYPLTTADLERSKRGKGRRTAAMIGGGSGLGMLVGGVASGGVGLVVGGLAGGGAGAVGAAFTGNRDLDIPAESIVHFKLSDELVIQQS
jgi:hypothetical protein